MFSRTGLSPTTATLSRNLPLTPRTTSHGRWTPHDHAPQHPPRNAHRLSHGTGLATSAFARHYSRNHFCFLFLWVLRCFTSPRSLPTPMYSVPGDTTSLVPGFPIRTSSDTRSVDSSPRHIAASHVLHQLLMPRHPPYALNNLTPQTIKDARIHYATLNTQPHPNPTTTTTPTHPSQGNQTR